MTDELLKEVERQLLSEHPVMAAMATKLERISTRAKEPYTAIVRVTFDGPALPEKQQFEVGLPCDDFDARPLIEAALRHCEKDLAASMKRAGYGGGL